jgi:hypothetical protein
VTWRATVTTTEMSTLDTEYLSVAVVHLDAVTGANLDPRGDVVQLAMKALPADADPVSGDWKLASWTGTPTTALAQLLVGPASPFGALAKSRYRVWVKVTESPTAPVLRAGHLIVN